MKNKDVQKGEFKEVFGLARGGMGIPLLIVTIFKLW